MSTAKTGDKVAVHYTGKLDDGSVFDTSAEREPLQFTLGEQGVIPGFQEVVVGLEPGQTATAKVPPEKAYGERRDGLVLDFDRSEVPQEVQQQIGAELQVSTQSGQTIPARIVAISEDKLTVDANHPLAGKNLTFDIQLVDIITA